MRILYVLLVLITSNLYVIADSVRLFSNTDIGAKNISSFTQDESGFLWIGTDYGLKRFDGTRFKSYFHSDSDTTSLNDNAILKILAINNDLWVATENGLHIYLPEKDAFKLIKLSGNSNSGYISDFAIDEKGNVWFIAGGIGLFYVNKNDYTVTGPYLTDYPIGKLIIDNEGECWITSTEMNCVLNFNPYSKKVKYYNEIKNNILYIAKNNKGEPVVMTSLGGYIFNKTFNKFEFQSYKKLKEPLSLKTVWSQNRSGDFLFSTSEGIKDLSSSFTVTTYLSYSNNIDLSNNVCTALFTDTFSNIWIGRDDGSIILVTNNNSFFKYTNLSFLYNKTVNNKILALTKGNKSDLWITTKNQELLHLDKDINLINIFKTSSSISAICCGTNDIYVWEDGIGLCSYKQVDGKKKVLYPFMQNRNCTGISITDNNELYISLYGYGLLKYNINNNKYEWFKSESSNLVNNWISTIRLDKENILWIGHSGGVSYMNTITDEIESIPESSWLRYVKCYSIDVDLNNNAWIGTSKGLCVLNRKNFRISQYSKSECTYNSTINTVIACQNGIIWYSTPNGICRFDSKTHLSTFFYGGYGIVDNYFLKNIGIKVEGGLIYFANENGLTSFNWRLLDNVQLNNEIIITDLVVNGKSINTTIKSGNKNIINKPIYKENDIYLSFNDNTFSLQLSMSNFYDSKNSCYEYRIDNKKWNQLPVGESELSFHRLSPGNYNIQIRAIENSNRSPLKLIRIHILPPWYFSNLAKVIYVILIVGIVLLIILVIYQKYRKEIDSEKIEYFMNISHDIRSPLTLLLNPLEILMKESKDESAIHMMNIMHLNTIRIKNLIDQMLDIKKMDDGKLKLHFTKTEIIEYIRELLGMFQFQAETHNIKLSLTYDCQDIYAWIDVNYMDKVLVNLIFNAFKFTPDGGTINIHVTHGFSDKYDLPLLNFVKISVSDTGKGLDESELSKIFDRFYQSKHKKSQTISPGYGIGLNMCKMLVELHHGKITAENRTDYTGCVFSIIIPQGKEHLKIEELELNSVVEHQFLFHNIHTKRCSMFNKKYNRGYKILVVDDDEEIVDFLYTQLASKYRIIRAYNVKKALELVFQNKPDLIISDIIMPDIDGLEFLQRIKSNIETNHIPFIIISTLNSVENRISGLKYGADGYITKPFNLLEISAMIDSLILTRKTLCGKYSNIQESENFKDIIVPDNEKVLMEKIIQVINNNFNNPNFSIDILSREVGISRTHLHRKMKECVGISTSDFIRNIRLKKACDLLINRNIDISQIAYAVGFKNVGYFATLFKRYYGITPTEYRNNKLSEL